MIAWFYDDRGVESLPLSVKPEELDAVASRFLRECADAASDMRALQRDARQLYDWLVAPVANRLDPARVLVIEPDGPVGAVPMQALLDENLQYLGERFAIVTSSGLADYQRREAAGPVTADLRAVAVASPTLGVETAKAFPPLEGTIREGESVAKRFRDSVLLTRERATLAAVELERGRTEVFHFAGHGFSNAGNGGLLLTPDERGSAGILDGTRMALQDWSHCRLAVLSACSTGTGETKGPVNPESLVRGFLWAGVARVIASRWNVDNETAIAFMDQFYADLLSGSSPAVALQHAAGRVHEDKAKRHPYFWAGFQSFGTR
jgi:CHAT domain-containing protein